MKKIKRFFAGFLSSVMILSAMPAFAASTGSVASDKSIGSDTVQGASTSYEEVGVGSSKTNVYLTVDNSNIKVGVPTTIILNGSPNENGEYVAQYGVSVSGDISGGSILTVEPSDNEVALQQAGKDDITATITQSQTQFSSDDLKNNLVTQGTVSATALTAGSWNGQTSFNIQLNQIEWYDITSQLNLADADNTHWNKFGILTEGNETTPYRTVNIPVSAGETYRVSGNVWGGDRLLIAMSELGRGGQYIVDNAMIPAVDVNGSGVITDQILTIPEGANWLCISTAKFALSQFKLEKLGNNVVNFAPYTSEDFYWNFDKPYVTITVDDTNDNIDEIAEVFARHNMPCNYATQYDRLGSKAYDGRTKKDILLEAQASGSEILAHHYVVLDSTYSDDVYTEVYENTKTNLENEGFIVNGLIVAGGAGYSSQDFSNSTKHAYNAGYLYSDLTAQNNVYNHRYYNPRVWGDTSDITYWQNQIDKLVAKGTGWLNIASHLDAEWEFSHTMNPDMLDQILTYCEEKGVEVVTWKTLYDNCGMNK